MSSRRVLQRMGASLACLDSKDDEALRVTVGCALAAGGAAAAADLGFGLELSKLYRIAGSEASARFAPFRALPTGRRTPIVSLFHSDAQAVCQQVS